MYKRSLSSLALGSLTCLASVSLYANTLTWTGNAGDNQWSSAANWSPEQVPAAGDSVSISGVADPILLDAPTAELDSLALSGATLSLNHWNTRIRATTVTIGEGGIVTSKGPFDESLDGEGNLASRVWIDCTDLTIALGGAIDVTGKGYGGHDPNQYSYHATGFGPGKGEGRYRGGSHGGSTLEYPKDNSYGNLKAPVDPGSGGGSDYGSHGGNGGGAVRIEATGTVTVNGSILADGSIAKSNYGASGAGGSIYITCASFAGTAGTLRAAGGKGWVQGYNANSELANGYPSGSALNGAGGRIAIVTTSDAVPAVSGMNFDVSYGEVFGETMDRLNKAEDGTLYFSNPDLFLAQDGAGFTGRLYIDDFTSWEIQGNRTLTGSMRFLNKHLNITATGDLTLSGENASLTLGGTLESDGESTVVPSLTVAGAFRLENGAKLTFCAPGPDANETLETVIPLEERLPKLIADSVFVGANSAILSGRAFNTTTNVLGEYVYSSRIWIECNNLTVDENGAIDASASGYIGNGRRVSDNALQDGNGPARGGNNGGQGAGHGGIGTDRTKNNGLLPYGSIEEPVTAGSSGGCRDGRGGHGGGIVRIIATENVSVQGAIRANAEAVYESPNNQFAGQTSGAGGSVYITCNRFFGENGSIEAKGGDSYVLFVAHTKYGFNGGGGRIAIHYNPEVQQASDVSGMTFDVSTGCLGYETTNNVRNEYYSRRNRAHPGTLYFPDSTLFLAQNGIGFSGQIYIPGFTSWTVEGDLTLTDQQLWFPIDGFQMNVSGNLTLSGLASSLRFGGSTREYTQSHNFVRYRSGTTPWSLTVGGNFTLGQGVTFEAFPADGDIATEATAYGAYVNVGGALTLEPLAILNTRSAPNNGASAFYTAGSVDIQETALVNAVDFGLPSGTNEHGGYGIGFWNGTGGGYGGFGGYSFATTNNQGVIRYSGYPYGDPLRPWHPGSGGSMWVANDTGHRGGGGAVRIRTTGNFVLNGTINASGEHLGTVNAWTTVAAGSGGGIFLESNSFSGSGSLIADGGSMITNARDVRLCAGGGGRIAVYTGIPYDPATMNESYLDVSETAPETFTGTASVLGGVFENTKFDPALYPAYSGTDGTIRFIRAYVPYTVIFFR